MPSFVAGTSKLRKPSRRELVFLAVLSLFIAVLEPFEPYDWVQSSLTAGANSKPYKGDAVIVAIDEQTENSLPQKAWSKSNLADLLEAIESASPKQIVIDQQYFEDDSEGGGPRLQSALNTLAEKPYWRIELSPEDAEELSSSETFPSQEKLATTTSRLAPELVGQVRPAIMTFSRYAFGAPIYAASGLETAEGTLPSLANVMVEGVPVTQRNAYNIDLSYDPATIPVISAGKVLAGDFEAGSIAGKRVLVSHTSKLFRDTFDTPHDPYTSRAAATVMAAQTLADGPPVEIGWLPSFVVGLLAAVLWLVLPVPFGRMVAAATFVAIFVSPLLLERHLIFQQTSHGLSLLLVLAIGKVWQRGRNAIRTYRGAAETKSRFLAQASHDLRQPIHAIGLLAERLGQTELSRDQAELVKRISWSVDNASRMFRSLLDIAAIESGTLETNIGAVAINDLLADIDSQNGLAAEQAKVELRLVPSDLVVRTDRALVGTMLQNLVSNAIKYSPGSTVLVGCRRRGGKVALLVVDNGSGISATELEHVKKEFYRSSGTSSLSSDNKGLGLAIVNRLCGMLGLKFSLASMEGRGTTASIGGMSVINGSEAVAPSRSERRFPLSGMCIAVADDDRETLSATCRLLEQWGCKAEAHNSLPGKLPECDVLLSDYDFGEGLTLAKRPDFVAQLHGAGKQLIVVSGHHPDHIRRTIPAHEGLILSKPLRAAELRSALMSVRRTEDLVSSTN